LTGEASRNRGIACFAQCVSHRGWHAHAAVCVGMLGRVPAACPANNAPGMPPESDAVLFRRGLTLILEESPLYYLH